MGEFIGLIMFFLIKIIGLIIFFLIFLFFLCNSNYIKKYDKEIEERQKIEKINNLKTKICSWCLEHEFVKLENNDDYEKYNIMLKELNVNNEPEIKNILFSVINAEDFQKKIKMQVQQKKELEWQQYISLAECVYNKCVSLNINIDNDYESIEIVANSFDISNDMVKQMYKDAKNKVELQNRKRIENELIEQNKSIEYAKELSRLYGKNRYYFRKLPVTEQNIIKQKLIDDRNQSDLRKLMDINVLNYEILDTNNINVNIEINYNNKIKILNQDAIIDGSFLVKIIDVDNNEVAIGYLNGKYLSPSKFGFYKQVYDVLCKKVSNSNLENDCRYNVVIDTIKLWMMEK